MLRRLLIGLVLGLIVGGVVAAGLVAGLGVPTFASAGGAVLAYVAAALTGVLTGLVAGKPIWASGAKIEAGLKAFFGALIGAGVMFALRQWVGSWAIDLPAIGAHGATPIADLPATALPLVAAVLGGLFELDNTDGDKSGDKAAGKTGAAASAAGKGRVRVTAEGARPPRRSVEGADVDSTDDVDVASRRGKH